MTDSSSSSSTVMVEHESAEEAEEDVEEENKPNYKSEGKFVHEGRNASLIKADVFMISACSDEVGIAGTKTLDIGAELFDIPDRVGLTGSLLTSALLDILYKTDTEATAISNLDLLKGLRTKMENLGLDGLVPLFSSGKEVDMDEPFSIVPPDCEGTKRALMVGINYVGTEGELKACHNDALNMKNYLTKVHGFEEENIALLLDDGKCKSPTKWNICTALHSMVKSSKAGDVCVFLFSGKGGAVTDSDGEEENGWDEAICPVDCFTEGGMIVDDELFEQVIIPLKEGVTFVAIMDCSYSGTVLDLPCRFEFNAPAVVEAPAPATVEEPTPAAVEDEGAHETDANKRKDADDAANDDMMAMLSMLMMMQAKKKFSKKKSTELKGKVDAMMGFLLS